MKAFIAPELTPIEDLVEGVYAMSGDTPYKYNPDWSYRIMDNYGSDSGSHTDLTIQLTHGGQDYLSPGGSRLVTEWATDFKINELNCSSGNANVSITGNNSFTLTTTQGVNNRGENVGITLWVTGETELGSTAIGVSGGSAEQNAHITNGITLTGWHYE